MELCFHVSQLLLVDQTRGADLSLVLVGFSFTVAKGFVPLRNVTQRVKQAYYTEKSQDNTIVVLNFILVYSYLGKSSGRGS